MHNAVVMPKRAAAHPQGHEVQLARHHVLGPHLITERLLPLLRAAGGASVVFMSSGGGMYSSPLVVDDIEYRHGYNGVRAYARHQEDAGGPGRLVGAPAGGHRHPGGEHAPRLGGDPGVAEYLPRFRIITKPLLRNVVDGADTAVWLVATRPPSKPGHFWHDRSQRPTTFGWQRHEDPAKVRRFLAQVSRLTGTAEGGPACAPERSAVTARPAVARGGSAATAPGGRCPPARHSDHRTPTAARRRAAAPRRREAVVHLLVDGVGVEVVQQFLEAVEGQDAQLAQQVGHPRVVLGARPARLGKRWPR